MVPAVFTVNAFWFLAGKKNVTKNWIFYGFIAVNLAAVTVILHFSGGQDSPFPFLYLISVVSAALISLRATIAVGIFSLGLFILLIFFEPPIGVQLPVFTRILRLILLEVIVVFQSYYFISNINKYQREISKLKDKFLFGTIHSLRAPATALRWTFERFSKPDFLRRNPEMQKEVEMLREADERIMFLINDILAIAKEGRPDMALRKDAISLSELIKASLLNFQDIAAKKKIVLQYLPEENLPKVQGDAERLKEIFDNLLDNGIKYNREGGSVIITHEVAGNILKTIIQDTGHGISAEEMPKLFVPYFRSRKDIVGTGLGLYISRALAEKMQGKIEASSVLGEGTTFAVLLPIFIEKNNVLRAQ